MGSKGLSDIQPMIDPTANRQRLFRDFSLAGEESTIDRRRRVCSEEIEVNG